MKGLSKSWLISRISDVIKHPELHTREIPIFIGLAVLLVFIILVIVALIFVRPSSKTGELGIEENKEAEEEKISGISIVGTYIVLFLFTTLAIVSIATTTIYSSKPRFCAGCHEMRPAYEKSMRSDHKNISCLSCHQRPGILGALSAKLQLAEMVISKTGIVGSVISAGVTNESCLECHSNILESVDKVGTLRVKHKEPVESGYRCTDCHYSKGLFHSEKRKLDAFRMSSCMDCHNQERASAECNTCHTQGNRVTSYSNRDDYPMVNLPGMISCKGCHVVQYCLICHKMELPHRQAWKLGEHRLEALVYKRLCWECHDEKNCKKCHTEASPHGDDWAEKHGSAAKLSIASCYSCHKTDFCLSCHVDITSFKIKGIISKPEATLRNH